jgi:hypothetical protein
MASEQNTSCSCTPEGEQFAVPLTKNQRWLTCDAAELTQNNTNRHDRRTIHKFLSLGVPVLQKVKSAFIAEEGDIQVCLLVHDEEVGPTKNAAEQKSLLRVDVCHITEDGQLEARLSVNGEAGQQLLEAFTFDFPGAVWTSQQRNPFCFFTNPKKIKALETLQSATQNIDMLGTYVGYVSYGKFLEIIRKNDIDKISVLVPK